MRAPGPDDPGVVELRQYTLHPGRRDELVELFDTHFVESQEAVGGQVVGEFTDLDHPDRFVWLRGFADLAARLRMLTEFYGGPVWAEHGPAANATMVDSDDVLLLRPVLVGDPPAGQGAYLGRVLHHDGPVDDAWADDVVARTQAVLAQEGAAPVHVLRTLEAVNDFPRLPVRDEHVLVVLARADDPEHATRVGAALDADPAWSRSVATRAARPPQRLRLAPTARSRLT